MKTSEQFRFFVAAAHTDGCLGEEEEIVLRRLGRELAVPEAEVNRAIAERGGGAARIPTDPAECDALVDRLVEVIRVDDEVRPQERRLLRKILERCGRREEHIAALLDRPAAEAPAAPRVGAARIGAAADVVALSIWYRVSGVLTWGAAVLAVAAGLDIGYVALFAASGFVTFLLGRGLARFSGIALGVAGVLNVLAVPVSLAYVVMVLRPLITKSPLIGLAEAAVPAAQLIYAIAAARLLFSAEARECERRAPSVPLSAAVRSAFFWVPPAVAAVATGLMLARG